jgi:hypothetical protein
MATTVVYLNTEADAPGLLRPVNYYKFSDVSEVLVASIIKAIALMMEAASTSETQTVFYQTTQRNSPQDSHLQSRCRENLTPQL